MALAAMKRADVAAFLHDAGGGEVLRAINEGGQLAGLQDEADLAAWEAT
jgi:hypothetical protein